MAMLLAYLFTLLWRFVAIDTLGNILSGCTCKRFADAVSVEDQALE